MKERRKGKNERESKWPFGRWFTGVRGTDAVNAATARCNANSYGKTTRIVM